MYYEQKQHQLVIVKVVETHATCMKIRGSVVSLSFIFPHPPEDENKNKEGRIP